MTAAGPGTCPTLSPSILDIVTCPLQATPDEIAALQRLLSSDERQRADRFRIDRGRERFVVARGRLRRILGRLTGVPPAGVRFTTTPAGKPGLEGGGRLRFNLAHSDELMLCAVTLDHEVGVDVERVRDNLDHLEIARRFFAAAEVRSLEALPAASRLDAFFACWTRKESVVKATGEGLGRALDSFVVSVDPARAILLSSDSPLGRPEDWTLLAVPVPPGYQAAAAVRGRASLRAWTWPPDWMDFMQTP
jgi:4'-phosphopantetheinyl transferase